MNTIIPAVAFGDGPDVANQDEGTYVYELIDIFSHTNLRAEVQKQPSVSTMCT